MLGYHILLSVDQVTGINISVIKQHIEGLPYTPHLYMHEVQKPQKQFKIMQLHALLPASYI